MKMKASVEAKNYRLARSNQPMYLSGLNVQAHVLLLTKMTSFDGSLVYSQTLC